MTQRYLSENNTSWLNGCDVCANRLCICLGGRTVGLRGRGSSRQGKGAERSPLSLPCHTCLPLPVTRCTDAKRLYVFAPTPRHTNARATMVHACSTPLFSTSGILIPGSSSAAQGVVPCVYLWGCFRPSFLNRCVCAPLSSGACISIFVDGGAGCSSPRASQHDVTSLRACVRVVCACIACIAYTPLHHHHRNAPHTPHTRVPFLEDMLFFGVLRLWCVDTPCCVKAGVHVTPLWRAPYLQHRQQCVSSPRRWYHPWSSPLWGCGATAPAAFWLDIGTMFSFPQT